MAQIDPELSRLLTFFVEKQKELAKLLMESSPTTRRHPEKYLAKPNSNPLSPTTPSPEMATMGA